MTPTRITAPAGVHPSDGYAHAVTGTGRIVALAGQLPLAPDGTFVGAGDPEAQARQMFENLRNCLAAAGATFANLIRLNYFLTDIAHVPVVLSVRDEFIDPAHLPASTVVQGHRPVPPGPPHGDRRAGPPGLDRSCCDSA
ncbi:MAG TPA: RidA family protein [Actinophytocola sp.]|jgi:enamine deaminase RidA (YjgF/YER057c/UK114 family)|uniref:RidA family protein n=1 Tax=Actinophytocola sp. TaxID=1872138 RepID=UPI002DF7757D|nr:RidA family protein [Actinophytocola sp.]